MAQEPTFHNDFFISYTHSPRDLKAAAYVQAQLEHYRIPKEIRRRLPEHKDTIRVFRDQSELSASSDLTREIHDQLLHSRYLIVICSPRAKQSRWVENEIQMFRQLRDARHILPVLIDGEPLDAFPDCLMETEPLAADCRGETLQKMRRSIRREKYRLLAPALGCTYDELVQRKRAYNARRLATGAAAAGLIGLVFGGVTLSRNLQIRRLNTENEHKRAKMLALQSETLLKEGDREMALRTAREALAAWPDLGSARLALENALYVYQKGNYNNVYPLTKLPMEDTKSGVFAMDPGGEVYGAGDVSGNFYFWDLSKQEQIAAFRPQLGVFASTGEGQTGLWMPDERRAVMLMDSDLICYDFREQRVLWQMDQEAQLQGEDAYAPVQTGYCVDAAGESLLQGLISREGTLRVYRIDLEDGTVGTVAKVQLPEEDSYYFYKVLLMVPNETENFLAVGVYKEYPEEETRSLLYRMDLKAGTGALVDEVDGLQPRSAAFHDTDLYALFAQPTFMPEYTNFYEYLPSCLRSYGGENTLRWSYEDHYVDREGICNIQVTENKERDPAAVLSVINSSKLQNFTLEGALLTEYAYGSGIVGHSQGTKDACFVMTADGKLHKPLRRGGKDNNDYYGHTDTRVSLRGAVQSREDIWVLLPAQGKEIYLFGNGAGVETEPVAGTKTVQDLCPRADGNWFFLREYDEDAGTVSFSLWDAAVPEAMWHSPEAERLLEFSGFGFLGDYAYASCKNTFFLFDTRAGTLRSSYTDEDTSDPEAAFSHYTLWEDETGTLQTWIETWDGRMLHLTGEDLTLQKAWPKEDWEEQLKEALLEGGVSFQGDFYQVSFGRYLLLQDSVFSDTRAQDAYLRLFDLEQMRLIPIPQIGTQLLINRGILARCAFSERGKELLICGSDDALHLVDTSTGEEIMKAPLEGRKVISMAVTPSGERILAQLSDYYLYSCNVREGVLKVCEQTPALPVTAWQFMDETRVQAEYSSGVTWLGFYRYRLNEKDTWEAYSALGSCKYAAGAWGYLTDEEGGLLRTPILDVPGLLEQAGVLLEGKQADPVDLAKYGLESENAY